MKRILHGLMCLMMLCVATTARAQLWLSGAVQYSAYYPTGDAGSEPGEFDNIVGSLNSQVVLNGQPRGTSFALATGPNFFTYYNVSGLGYNGFSLYFDPTGAPFSRPYNTLPDLVVFGSNTPLTPVPGAQVQTNGQYSGTQPWTGASSFTGGGRTATVTQFQSNGDGSGSFTITVSGLAAPASLSLDAVSSCVHDGARTVVVNVDMSNVADAVVGGQFFLQYDASVLSFVSAATAGPFSQEVYRSIPAPVRSVGLIDYAVGLPGGGPGTTSNTAMATFTFHASGDVCSTASNLVVFRPVPPPYPPTRLTNQNGDTVAAAQHALSSITIDSTAPVITCPANIVTNADAGGCTATLSYNEAFNVAPTLSNTPAPGVYYTDRYPPAGFTRAFFNGDNRLKHSISSADSIAHRPAGYQFNFYNTQGRDLTVNIPSGQNLGIDLYIDPSWLVPGTVRRADLWAVGNDISNVISDYAVIGFSSSNPSGDATGTENTDPTSPLATPRWRTYDNGTGAWTVVGPTPTAGWHRLEMTLVGSSVVYTLDHAVVSTISNYGSIRFSAVLIQAYNFGNFSQDGDSYDVYWDNLTTGPQAAFATDNCTASPAVSGVRSDGHALTDAYPSGVTTVTWTATDTCGNASSCASTVTVNSSNTVVAAVQLEGVSPGPFDRCITFVLDDCSTSISQVVTFTGGIGGATFDVPCGPHSCITARDKRHTLRRAANDPSHFSIVGSQYVANFTGTDPVTGKQLIGGNLNDDNVIDILDFGGFVGQYNQNYGTANTTCSTAYPHADISGDGLVTTADYTYIHNHFLRFNEADCCGITGLNGLPRISVPELIASGRGDLVIADLNHDGWLDEADMAVFAAHGGIPACSADFNGDGDTGTDADIEAFFACLAGNCCRTCGSADFDGDGDIGTDADVEAFFRVLAGGPC